MLRAGPSAQVTLGSSHVCGLRRTFSRCHSFWNHLFFFLRARLKPIELNQSTNLINTFHVSIRITFSSGNSEGALPWRCYLFLLLLIHIIHHENIFQAGSPPRIPQINSIAVNMRGKYPGRYTLNILFFPISMLAELGPCISLLSCWMEEHPVVVTINNELGNRIQKRSASCTYN